ncbi:type IV pilus biogenesis protein PilM [Halalkalibacter akibai]|uniref:Pilus assembly protein PilM n=1 Tax=Halalkalibacter akibai (strain ATCC 43226 / DSM 21942 / CIP 109018 / JCM 9157 / 1139) TaxID=1236973 RepID=W4QTM1_HALA3|nr:pilus assembly protein PilM [Halalkalibacter akibai]GAE34948.1 hypothetical protein JCM9157_2033 [Halalkalibacter akibai JCM 9157]
MLFNNKYSGIDFRDNKVTFATVKLDKQAPILEDIYETPLKENVVNNGVVMEKGLLSTALRTYFQSGKVNSKQAHLAIPTQNTLIRKITTLPDLEEKELAKLLQFQIGETIHLPFEDPIYDFVKIGSILPKGEQSANEDDDFTLEDLTNKVEKEMQGPKSEILFFATSRPISQSLMETCEKAGFKPQTAEIRGLSLQRLLMYLHPSWLKGTEMIMDVTEETVDIHIFKNDLIVFSRTMAIESNDYIQTPTPEAEVLSFSDDALIQTEVAATVEPVAWDIDQYVSAVISEFQKAQNFFRYSLGERDSEFSRIILTGDYASKIASSLSSRLQMDISSIDYSSILSHDNMTQQQLDSCSVAIGLALRTNDKPDKNRKLK